MKLPVNYNDLHHTKRRLVREEYVRLQRGRCYHCQQLLSLPPHSNILKLPVIESLFPANFFKWPIHLHHDHETGMTIGAVHCYCNAILWQYHNE